MSNKNFNSSVLERNRQSRAIYSNYRINMLGIEQGIPANPISIKGGSADITQALVQGPIVFTPTELTAILNNNSGSTAASGPPAPPPGPTPLVFSSAGTPLPTLQSFTIPTGYTLLTYVIIGGGGGGSAGGGDGSNYFTSGLGGGSGGIRSETVPIVGGVTIISITLGSGGAAGAPAFTGLVPGENGTSTTLTVTTLGATSTTYNAGGGEGSQTNMAGADGGNPGGVSGNNSTGQGGALTGTFAPYGANAFAPYGRGGNGAAADPVTGLAQPGGAGYYLITLT